MKLIFFFCALALFFVFSSHSGCGDTRSDDCEFGCPPVYVLAQFNDINDTMYVGDTLIMTLQIPDSVEELSEEGLLYTTHVSTFENMWSYTNMFKIDTMEKYKLAMDTSNLERLRLEGGEYRCCTFSTAYPFRHKMRYIFRKPGDYFLNCGHDNACKINGVERVMVIEYNIPEKHFEWLEPYIVPNGGTVAGLKMEDNLDQTNYAPIRVLEK